MGTLFSSLSDSAVVSWRKDARSVLLECFSSGVIGVIADLLSQLIRSPELRHPSAFKKLNIRSIISYFVFGVITAPISQQLFSLLEFLLKDTPEGFGKLFKKVAIERALFAPLFLFLYKLLIPFLQGQPISDVIRNIPQGFLRTLSISILVWSPFSYVNTNYVPIEKRVLAANLMGLLWTVFLSYQAAK